MEYVVDQAWRFLIKLGIDLRQPQSEELSQVNKLSGREFTFLFLIAAIITYALYWIAVIDPHPSH